MRMTTRLWARFESKGRPKDTKQIHGTMREIILESAAWLASVYMGSYITIRIARTEIELDSVRMGSETEMMSELESLIADQEELFNGSDSAPSPDVTGVSE